MIFKQDDFVQKFGKINDQYGGLRDTGKDKLGDPMGHSIAAFFLNGGRQAYIVRLARDGTPELVAASTGITNPADPAEIFEFTAVDPGSWGNDLVVRMELLDATDPALGYLVQVGHGEGDDFAALEAFDQVSLVPDDPRYLVEVINDGSSLVDVEDGKTAADLSYTRRGSLTSDNLAALGAPEFDTLAGKTLTLEFNGGPTQAAIVFPVASAPDKKTSLASVAEFIQSEVRKTAGPAPHPAIDFTAELIDNKLVFTSGTESDGTSPSSVGAVGSAAPTSARGILGLGASAVADSVTSTADLPYAAGEDAKLSAGSDGEPPQLADYQAALTKLENYRDASIICVPGRQWDPDGSSDLIGKSVIEAAVAACGEDAQPHGRRRSAEARRAEHREGGQGLGLPTSTYTALYYPWVEVANPYYNAEKNPGGRRRCSCRRPASPPACGRASTAAAACGRRRPAWRPTLLGCRPGVQVERRRAGPAQPAGRQLPPHAAELRPGDLGHAHAVHQGRSRVALRAGAAHRDLHRAEHLQRHPVGGVRAQRPPAVVFAARQHRRRS